MNLSTLQSDAIGIQFCGGIKWMIITETVQTIFSQRQNSSFHVFTVIFPFHYRT